VGYILLGDLMLDYYRQQSEITEPGEHSRYLDDLPHETAGLVQVVRHLLFSPYKKEYAAQLPSPLVNNGFGIRVIAEMLAYLVGKDGCSLTQPRQPEHGLFANCRNFATLLVTMLRHQGIPARLRIGFAGYLGGENTWWDHRLAEYWSAAEERWVLVDAIWDGRSPINRLDIPCQPSFYLAGEAWQLCRTGQLDPQQFADSPTDRGLPMIRYALLHDFDALNKMELLGCDAWHPLLEKAETAVTPTDYAFLDQIAEFTIQADEHHVELRQLYEQSDYGRAVCKQWADIQINKRP
jgi:excinuclease ABC subunit A